MSNIFKVKAVLFDLDGVLYVGNKPVEGAIDAVNAIRNAGIVCRFVTNTSTLSLASLQQKLNQLGFNIAQSEIMSAPQAAIQYLSQQPNPICRLLLAEDVKQDFAHFTQSDVHANFIIVGDIGNAWTYNMLNEVFARLMEGAKLIAIHKNRFWQTEQGLQMDIGAFIDGLEYASNTTAMIIGKPSTDFFNAVLTNIGLTADEVLMVGDDIDSDVGGAQATGIKGVLVRTGKYRQAYTESSAIKPDAIIDSIADLPSLLLSQ
ncbi:MAG: TIGR01458 family HAD-type hydrolase [Methylophilus sp.]|nr:TIGR01458 family HAD-type hydrolase [Methylophilus sp.]